MTDPYICPCGKVRIRTPSGYVCPDGHGRLYLSRTWTSERHRAFLAWREKLLEAVRVQPWPTHKRAAFRIGDDDRLWVYVDGHEPCTPKTQLYGRERIAKVRTGKGWLVRRFVLMPTKGK